MKNLEIKNQIAIVGCGPRGLSALEALFKYYRLKTDSIHFIVNIFEPAEHAGAGRVWNLNQSDSNWMNISDRALENLHGRAVIKFRNFIIPEFPSFIEWSSLKEFEDQNDSNTYDKFPPRSRMGHYLSERFQSIANVLIQHNILVIFKRKVLKVESKQEHLWLTDVEGVIYKCDECLLTIGHQPIEPSEQIERWKIASKKYNTNFITEPYNEVLYSSISAEETVAIRGFGLAAIDIIRLLTLDRGATFKVMNASNYELKYVPSSKSIKQIIPFSLDGLPPVPKPIGVEVDEFFKPNENQIERFTQHIRNELSNIEEITSTDFLTKAFSDIASEIFLNLEEKRIESDITTSDVESLISDWLKNMETKHGLILDIAMDLELYMTKSVQMAIGKAPISLDYCIGQVWRHLQPTIYKELSHSNLSNAIISDIIALDESTKRYSYGPPVESVAQLIALSKAGLLNLDFISDPKIETNQSGWDLTFKGKRVAAQTMVDSVLASPQLKRINSELIESLLNDKLLSLVTSELGVETETNGLVTLAKTDEAVNLSMLGRNCKGSVIGVDAILECFGPRIDDWAEGIVERII